LLKVTLGILENGQTLKAGDLVEDKTLKTSMSPAQNLSAYLQNLNYAAQKFVKLNCPSKDDYKECRERMITADGIEWVVSRKDNETGLMAIELLNERGFFGKESTWNIIFYKR
jgi:hypothetical protein